MAVDSRPDNTNVLRGFRCPRVNCRSVGPFYIFGTATFYVEDDGSDSFEELTFDDRDDNPMRCHRCGYAGVVGQFRKVHPLPDDQALFIGAASRRVHRIGGKDAEWRRHPEQGVGWCWIGGYAYRDCTEQLTLPPARHRVFVEVSEHIGPMPLNEIANQAFGMPSPPLTGNVIVIPKALLR